MHPAKIRLRLIYSAELNRVFFLPLNAVLKTIENETEKCTRMFEDKKTKNEND